MTYIGTQHIFRQLHASLCNATLLRQVHCSAANKNRVQHPACGQERFQR